MLHVHSCITVCITSCSDMHVYTCDCIEWYMYIIKSTDVIEYSAVCTYMYCTCTRSQLRCLLPSTLSLPPPSLHCACIRHNVLQIFTRDHLIQHTHKYMCIYVCTSTFLYTCIRCVHNVCTIVFIVYTYVYTYCNSCVGTWFLCDVPPCEEVRLSMSVCICLKGRRMM